MTGLRDILRKKAKVQDEDVAHHGGDATGRPEIKIIRTTTEKQEILQPPEFPDQNTRPDRRAPNFSKPRLGYRESANAMFTNDPTARRSFDDHHQLREKSPSSPPHKEKRSIFSRSGRSRSKSDASNHLPINLGEAPPLPTISVSGAQDQEEKTQREARWEKRATMLATNNSLLDSASQRSVSRERSPSTSDMEGDVDIQEAIRLHEAGNLATSTRMFGRLADPTGANNALSQVLYGLALRHGWGVEVDLQQGIHYLSLAAANSANIEQQALAAGMKKGGAARGELVLAIFELANCFRQGWGVNKDAAAARQYYETAANLGDADAMEEAAWCYLEGFGGAKDKFKAAQYLRLAEKTGGKTVGNSWIWKDKYNPR
ncbi:hypothetical protein AMS68_002602 [Peltaster fructicola]|uniref:HCP-like protein n=1 Tax=Peltaster fructicola TaxID=286661 RepID=A0A6H0XR19_9PEZI|nr:hypothetical protein AMS68_002602 [Peltaster fructicola]